MQLFRCQYCKSILKVINYRSSFMKIYNCNCDKHGYTFNWVLDLAVNNPNALPYGYWMWVDFKDGEHIFRHVTPKPVGCFIFR